jgi:hypothetical protein
MSAVIDLPKTNFRKDLLKEMDMDDLKKPLYFNKELRQLLSTDFFNKKNENVSREIIEDEKRNKRSDKCGRGRR